MVRQVSKHLQFWSAISQCWFARHTIQYTQLTKVKHDIEPEVEHYVVQSQNYIFWVQFS